MRMLQPFFKPPHGAVQCVLGLRHALQDDPGAVLVLGEVGALAKLADERHRAEHRLVRCCVAAPPYVNLVVELAISGHSCGAGGQSSHERLPNAFARLQQVYRCLRV